MKFKPSDKAGGLLVELGPREAQLPPLGAGKTAGTLSVFKLRRILVPVDFSDCSKKALQYAIPFAKQFGADLMLLSVVPPNPPIAEMGPVDVVSIDDARKELEALRGIVGVTVSVHSVLRTGEPHVEIIRAAAELAIDLIILSTHGRTGVARVLMGSTAEKVVRFAGCPVLVVREQEHDFVGGGTGLEDSTTRKEGA
jgi:universal stress protein A